jgi:hypothetical protein
MAEILLVVPPRNFEGSYEQYSLSNDLITSYREEGIFTYLTLSRPLEPLETTVIKLSFRIYLPQNPGIFGYTNQQANVSDWYPFVPPYDDTRLAGVPRVVDDDNIIVGESVVNEFSDFEVSLTLVSHADLIEVAASAPAMGLMVSSLTHSSMPAVLPSRSATAISNMKSPGWRHDPLLCFYE